MSATDMTEHFVTPLSPPMIVSGRVVVVDEDDGEEPFDFENALAVALSENWAKGADTSIYTYTVVMPNGRVYEVSDHYVTSAVPWTPPTATETTATVETMRAKSTMFPPTVTVTNP